MNRIPTYILLFSSMLLLTMCTFSKKKQFENAGGTLVLAIENEPSTFIAREVIDYYSATLLNQVLEGLVRLDTKTLAPSPALASSWETSPDGLSITFTLRDNVYFHPHNELDEKRLLTVEDVIFNIETACKKNKNGNSSVPYLLVYNNIKGAEDYFLGKTDKIEGLSAKNNQIIIHLNTPEPSFIDKLAMVNTSIVPPELIKNEKEFDLIGTGPFKLASVQLLNNNTAYVLVKNNDYYDTDNEGNALPYLDSVIFLVEEQSERRLDLFNDGTTHLINGLPPSKITSILDEKMEAFNSIPPIYELVRTPVLATHYYQFNLLREHFQDVRVRQAINYSIDRKAIVNTILNNQAYAPGLGGMIPPDAFSGYNFDEVKEQAGYNYNPEKARKLLAEAGFPNGEGFPTIDITFSIGSIHGQVADRIAQQLKNNLNINSNINGLSFEDKLKVQDYATGDITAAGWSADYFSPENFLYNAYGKLVPSDPKKPSPINQPRYYSTAFDSVFEKALTSTDLREKYYYFAQADKILLRDAPFIYIWYDENIKIIRSKVRNLNLNALNYYNYRDVYLKEWTKEEYLNRNKKEVTP